MDFPMGFWLFLICFINVLFEVINNYKSDKLCFVKDYLWKHICIIGWCPVRPRNLYYRLVPVDLKIYTLVTKIPRLWLDSWKNLFIFAKIIRLYGTVKWGKSEHQKIFKVILKLFCDGFSPVFLQKSWNQKFYFLFRDLTDRFWGWK